MNNKLLVPVVAIIAFGGGYLLNTQINIHGEMSSEVAASGEDKPLYWVAPMDANYRRDQPGLSPMGMELVPVYANNGADSLAGEDQEGLVKINPAVENNLGVRTAKVKRGELIQPLSTVGYVNFDEDKLWHLHSRVDGWIEKLHIKYEGEFVKAGRPLLELYSPALVNAQEDFINVLPRNNARTIASSMERLKTLGMTDVQIKALKKSRKIKQRITFYAPQDGYVTGLKVREGMFITPKQQVMAVGALDSVWVMAEVFERQASWLQEGGSATMALDYLPGRSWTGKVDYIYPILDPKTRTVKVRMRFDNRDEALKPNMFVRVDLSTQPLADTLSIPREALIRTGSQDRVVLSLGNGQYRSVAVKVGRIAGDWVEITQGLSDDESVVISAQFLLDSESSLSADFSRMTPRVAAANIARGEGRVISLMADHGMLTIDHGPIPEWQWPQMVMDFVTADGVSLSAIRANQTVGFELNKSPQGDYVITEIWVLPGSDSSDDVDHSQMDHDEMDHSQMNHDEMDHSQMNHDEMDHSQMNHDEMDHSQMDHGSKEQKQKQDKTGENQ